MSPRFLVTFIFLLITSLSYSQTDSLTFEGRVLEANTKAPMASVEIFIDELASDSITFTNLATTQTDGNGYYLLKIPASIIHGKKIFLQAVYPYYISETIHLRKPKSKNNNLIKLKPIQVAPDTRINPK